MNQAKVTFLNGLTGDRHSFRRGGCLSDPWPDVPWRGRKGHIGDPRQDPGGPRSSLQEEKAAGVTSGGLHATGPSGGPGLYGPETLTSTAVSGSPVNAFSDTIPIPSA